ncbi:hypothetical protein EX895_006589 [Sporisorium graminicola]|uniref:Zn(2)-C6 fungal-type domain-containing protein n=1 Tax=Sporisorium graminicola TaxID=280036 RepID=A0A4U7KLS3_9BASI|nr:hypothetical protein EX895_006589 [Sporisorium graminicola]TKY84687.1 hypothetical protein EX895_006589 [Sporisorium graminicola]
MSASSSAKDPRRRQYRSCDRCRVGKRACNAEYESVAEAIQSKVACSNCRKKGKTCTFQHVLSILGGVPSSSAPTGHLGDPATSPSSRANEKSDAAVEAHLQSQPASPAFTAENLNVVTESSSPNGSKRKRGEARTGPVAATALHNLLAIAPSSSTNRMTSTIDRIFLNDGLIRVYEGAAEQALKCWITSSNTPYMLADQSCADAASSSQQLVYWRICELDRGARTLLGHSTAAAASREKDIMDAFHSVVLAFAAQWTPSWIGGLANRTPHGLSLGKISENKIRLALWERARDKLQRVANVDSFRVIFALILFAWTEKPRQVLERVANQADIDLNGDNCALDTSDWQSPAEGSTFLLVAAMRKLLSIKFRIESKKRRGVSPWNGPNQKAKGVSLARSEAQCSSSGDAGERETMAGKIQFELESKRPGPTAGGSAGAGNTAADAVVTSRMEGTYHMLYWLCVVIDTETSVLRKHPPVVCDEDSEIISCIPFTSPSSDTHLDSPSTAHKGIWDDYIINTSKRKHLSDSFVTSWPSDTTKTAATLAFSTPVKVVMFRQISRLQMSFWRRASTQSVEQHIRSGLSIVYHWNQVYGPLIDSCRASHAQLPASIQSWYVLLAFPWYLAILLFVEMVQTIDMAGASDMQARSERARSGIFPRLRDRACSDLALLISAIQGTSFSHLDSTFEYVRNSGSNLLLTEPWSEILVHSITAVIKTEIRLHEGYCSSFQWRELDESHERITKCLWALQQLSDRSPSAAMAHQQLETLSSFRRQGQFALQQIPMASPPLQWDMSSAVAATTTGQNLGAVADTSMDGDDSSPESSSQSKGTTSSSDSWMEGADLSTWNGSVLAEDQDSLQSALNTYFASNATALALPIHINGTPSAAAGGDADTRDQVLPEAVDQSADLGHLLQSLVRANAPSQPMALTPQPLSGLPACLDKKEQLSIMETLAELADRPMLDPHSLNSGSTPSSSSSSSGSMETMFSFDSLAALAAGENGVYSTACAAVEEEPPSATCSPDSNSEPSNRPDREAAPKKAKLSHLAPSFASNLALDPPPLQSSVNPIPSILSYSTTVPSLAVQFAPQEPQYTSMLLQPPPLQHRQHDDLYTDDDDDDLVNYRASTLPSLGASSISTSV